MKRNLFLAAVTLLALSEVCPAEVTFEYIRLPDPGPGLCAVRVHVYRTNAFEDLRIECAVHQANVPRSGGRIWPTVWLSDFNLPYDSFDAAVDTHFLLTEEEVVKDGADVVETNDRSNPAGLYDPDYEFGNGTFDATGMRFAIKSSTGELDPEGYDLLQVVFPVGGGGPMEDPVRLRGFYWEYDGPNPGYRAIPEPGTVVPSVAGAICLLVLRLHNQKRRRNAGLT